jgi:HK97 family phage major capsid protein
VAMMKTVLTAPELGMHLRPEHRAALVAQLKAQGKNPMPTAQRAAAPVTKMTPRDALSHGLVASIREPSAEQKLLNSAAWLAEATGNHGVALRLWDKGADLLPMTKAAAEGVNTTGGAIVPNEVAATILAFRDKAVFRSNASVYQAAGDTLSIPRRTGTVSTTFVGENTALPTTQPTFDAITLTAKKLVAFGTFSTELEEDSAADVTRFFLADAGSALALREDVCGFNGDGTSAYAGMSGLNFLLNDSNHAGGRVAAASGHKTAALLDSEDLEALLGALPDRFWGNSPKLYVSGYMAANWLGRLAGANGGFMSNGAGVWSYAGIPVVTTNQLPGTGDVSGKIVALFGDLASAAALGSARPLTFSTSDQRYLEFDSLAWKITERFDIVCHNIGDSASAGAVVGLQATS